ncbi:response regulator [Trichocoleus sp. FACHB-591]|uniref:response regulator n=1 Tax=Trichocoleus sp. FACHB-591 TaxID=2692872 RepID=UPI001687F888|nr:response regulator [Trichocoleus sp. FACHB-591]MBD2095867.1 response regulator [Trichocoleus sp. FACHB-591]
MCDSNSLRKGLRVLVVDGDADSRDLLMALFEDYEVATITATCVSEALEIMQQACPDLLISEIVLPGEDGYSLMSQVKAWETTQRTRIPAIALTVCAEESAQRRAVAAGFCQHLPKPLDIDELIATMACLTQETQETAETASYAKL